jgi:hypothetical protein
MDNSLARMPTLFGDEAQAPEPVLESRCIKDPVGMWYAARLRHGIDDRMWFGLYRESVLAPRWYTCSHRYSDGLGALPLLLTERGLESPPPPDGRCGPAPHWRALWQRRRGNAPRVAIDWLQRDASLAGCAAHEPVSVLLSPEQTGEVDVAARAAGVSSTVWLQWTADRALRRTLARPGSLAGWIFPVNMRGAARSVDAHANHSSGVVLRVPEQYSPRELREQISSLLASDEHWRQWTLLNLGRWLGQPGVNLLYSLSQAAPGAYAGSYSNLGEWNVKGLAGLVGVAPGSPAYPVSAATALCNGRRSLGVRLHPVIGGNRRSAIEYLRCWRELSVGQPAAAEGGATARSGVAPAMASS